MSYDIDLGPEEFNYTYNVSGMWYDCYPEKGIREHYGKTGRESLPILRKLRQHMEDNYERLIEMNPENGWGDYWGALQFVTGMINAAIRHPDEVWVGD